MARHRRVWPVRWMSQALDVSTSGFYEWLTRAESNRSMANRTILVRIRESFEASHQTYGSPRVCRDLRDWNVPCSENRLPGRRMIGRGHAAQGGGGRETFGRAFAVGTDG